MITSTFQNDFDYAPGKTSETNDESSIRELERWDEKFGDSRSSVFAALERDKENAKKQYFPFKAFSFVLDFFD